MREVALVRNNSSVARLILHESSEGAYVFLCASMADGSAFADYWYESLEEAETACQEQYGVRSADWEPIDDPLPHCQQDWVEPVRIVGRADGSPQWERLERLEAGAWVELACVDGVWRPRSTS